MFVKMLVSAADSQGRDYRFGKVYHLPDDIAQEWIGAGLAVAVETDPEEVVNMLKALRGGLRAYTDTDPILVKMAEDEGIGITRLKSKFRIS